MRTFWCENVIFLVQKHGLWNKGKHQLEEQIYNCIIDFDIWFKIVLICQKGNKILVPNENFLMKMNY